MPSETRTILVVEDHASMSQAIERILRTGGYGTVVFATAEAALDAGAAATADCLVLDIRLPGMSGFELYRQLRCGGAKTPVVFVTAQEEPALREQAEQLGASGFLRKPFSGRALLDAVSEALGSI